MTTVPLVDITAQIAQLKPELLEVFESVLESHAFIQGRHAKQFEADFAAVLGIDPARVVGCSNGTSAISLALEALGVGCGDEVITVANTFVATAEAICHVGAVPVFVDVDGGTYGIDCDAVAAAITPKTRAIMPVHLYGNPSDLDPLVALAKKHNLWLIEDAAQAHLACYRGRFVGTIGDAATFSFYPAKNLGALGDAGLMIFANLQIAQRARKLLDHGRMTKYEHDMVGYNQRIDGLQAALLSAKLRHLKKWNEHRKRAAGQYDEALHKAGFHTARATAGVEPVHHLYVAEVSNRNETMQSLKQKGIETGIHYPVPLHLQPAFSGLGGQRGQFPIAEKAADRIMSLPICGSISLETVNTVIRHFLAVARP
jgi:dTDP-4-amino-4,6-dideoxygalactose transaminase